jgi:hypothetical protein
MYKVYESKAESLLKRAVKLGMQDWAVGYVRDKIDRAKFYRKESDRETKDRGMRGSRYRKAVESALDALDISEAYVRSVVK